MFVYQVSSVIESRPDPSGILWDFTMASPIECIRLQSSPIGIHFYRTDSGARPFRMMGDASASLCQHLEGLGWMTKDRVGGCRGR